MTPPPSSLEVFHPARPQPDSESRQPIPEEKEKEKENEKPWHAAFPAPRTTAPSSISRESLLRRFRAGEIGGREFLIVDLRRTDYEGGTISTSINLPAQTLYPTLPTLYTLCTNAQIPLVIFYCGSSRGRGTRAAGWFQDYIDDRQHADKGVGEGGCAADLAVEGESNGDLTVEGGGDGDGDHKEPAPVKTKIQSVILEGGIKGWVAAGKEYIEWMEGYEERVWTKNGET